ncbi:hypothetical protein DSM104299_04186 [Baekduia alba]|uniref:SRPBCC family protein n=1 Tax=Baekduia alba TaxID=2997333 RepID=UPI002341357D|nr:SRPBCC family protein [Baekduia alba]WCB95442.1 hypothetical protein DSM104299_04186 [Baekduia alba]
MISTHTATVTLPTDEQILITREFDAPAHLLWRAVTEPDLVKRWWGAERGQVDLVEIDLRVGGQWRYVMTAAGSDVEVGFHGEFYEIVEHERIVQTEVFEGFPDAHSVNTMTLVEADGRTTLTTLVQHQAKAHRDMQIDSGMEAGMQESFDALERVAAALR